MLVHAIAAGCEALAAPTAGTRPIYRVWYLVGGVWTVGWLGLGTAFLLGKTRFGYGFALCLFLAGLFTFLTARRFADRVRQRRHGPDALLHGGRGAGGGLRGRDLFPELALAMDGRDGCHRRDGAVASCSWW